MPENARFVNSITACVCSGATTCPFSQAGQPEQPRPGAGQPDGGAAEDDQREQDQRRGRDLVVAAWAGREAAAHRRYRMADGARSACQARGGGRSGRADAQRRGRRRPARGRDRRGVGSRCDAHGGARGQPGGGLTMSSAKRRTTTAARRAPRERRPPGRDAEARASRRAERSGTAGARGPARGRLRRATCCSTRSARWRSSLRRVASSDGRVGRARALVADAAGRDARRDLRAERRIGPG